MFPIKQPFSAEARATGLTPHLLEDDSLHLPRPISTLTLEPFNVTNSHLRLVSRSVIPADQCNMYGGVARGLWSHYEG